ncbi:CAP Gly-rich domain-containing protein [Choanephora cucurbitarum]|nr:CAP Gly-rich domain-containing protein [Choanephora cucurbitarum]
MSSVKRSSVVRDDFAIGSRVVVNDLLGTVRFFGNTSFQTGKWVGIELDEPQGKNSGIVQGKRYFECKPNHGVFVRPANVKINEDASAGSVSPSSAMRRKSVVSAPPMQRRKSIAPPSSPTVANSPQLQNKRKSTVIPSPPASINTRRKSVVSTAPLSPATNQTPIKRRPTSLLQSAPKNAPAVSSKSTVIPNARRKSIVPPKPTKTPITKRPRSNTQSLPPTPAPTIQSPSQPSAPDMAKSRTPITAPSTPENSNDVDEDIPENLMKLERNDLETQNDDIDSYLDGSTETVSSPLSIGTETARETVSSNDQDDEQDIETAPSEFTLEPEEEEKEEQPEEGLYKPVAQPVYGSLASSRPVSKSDQYL